MPEQSISLARQVRNYGITGLAIHLVGFVLGFIGIGLVLGGVIDIESGITSVVPLADLLYGLGLVLVIAVAARAGVPMKHMLIAGAVIGIGLFYKSAPHEIHIASGAGFGLVHPAHIMLGTILISISVAALTVLAIRYNRSKEFGRSRSH
ncbi:MAG: hypothetical protein M3239_00030 [Thermoproteota archaeon]|nr:hypothetical protein [Thermoproteota archaeon]